MNPDSDLVDDGIALGIERDGPGRRPVTRLARPAGRMTLAGGLVELVPRGEDCDVFTSMSLSRRDVADAAVSMLVVVPVPSTHLTLPTNLPV